MRKPAKGVKKSSNKDKQQVIQPAQPVLSEKAKGKRKAVDIVPEESEAEEDGEPIAIFLTQQQGSPDSLSPRPATVLPSPDVVLAPIVDGATSKHRKMETIDISQCNQIKCTVSAKMLEKSWGPLDPEDQLTISSKFNGVLSDAMEQCSSKKDRTKVQIVFNSLTNS